jgi:hypothetical protein
MAKSKTGKIERVPNWQRLKVNRTKEERKEYLARPEIRAWLKRQLPILRARGAEKILDVRAYAPRKFMRSPREWHEWTEIYIQVRKDNKKPAVKVITICGDPAPFYRTIKVKKSGSTKKRLRSREVSGHAKKAK